MKTQAEVARILLEGAQGQPAGKYVEVLAEDLVLALTPATDASHDPAEAPK